MRSLTYLLTTFLLTACLTTPPLPEAVQITFISMEKVTLQGLIIGSGNHSVAYEEPGYKIGFISDRKIQSDVFSDEAGSTNLALYPCGSKIRPDNILDFSYGKNITISTPRGKFVKDLSGGGFLYEAELARTNIDRQTALICGRVYFNIEDKNQKVEKALIISNEMELLSPT